MSDNMKTGGFQFSGNMQSPSVLELVILSEGLTRVTAGKTITFPSVFHMPDLNQSIGHLLTFVDVLGVVPSQEDAAFIDLSC